MTHSKNEWKDFVLTLLEKYKLTYRGAAMRVREQTGKSISAAYVNDWIVYDKIPSSEKAYTFLAAFDHTDAVKGFEILGLPIPVEWIEPKELIELGLRGANEIPEEGWRQIQEFIDDVMKGKKKQK